MSQLKLNVLGYPKVERNDQTISVNLNKALALLIYLAIGKSAQSRDVLATLFWPENDHKSARSNLRRALYRLNQQLGENILQSDANKIAIHPDADLLLDSVQFRQIVESCLPQGEPKQNLNQEQLKHLTQAVDLYHDHFLSGFAIADSNEFEEWQFFERDHLRQLFANALVQLSDSYFQQGEYKQAIEYARRRLSLDPLHEPAHRLLMQLYAYNHQQMAALRQYEECSRLLKEELGVETDTETKDLLQAIRSNLFPGKAATTGQGDDSGQQQYTTQTAHGSDFQFQANADKIESSQALQQQTVNTNRVECPVTHYAKSGSVHIAYQVFGRGPVDLIMVPGFISHIENYWESQAMTTWLEDLAQSARVVMFDKRGTGMSDPVYPLPDFDVRMDDVATVMDAVGIDSAYVMGISEGGSLASLFAAVHPERCLGLILYGSFASFSSWFKTREELQGLFDYIESGWGSGESLSLFAPSVQGDSAFKGWWGKFERLGASPGAAVSLMEMNSEIDTISILPAIKASTLVIHRKQDVLIDVEAGRLLANQISGAHYIELDGSDHLPWVGNNSKQITRAIAEFIQDHDFPVFSNTVLTTLLSVELSTGNSDSQTIPSATSAVTKTVTRFRGKMLNPGDNFLFASFDGPARAVHCACNLVDKFGTAPISIKACVQTGEVEIDNNQVSGGIVNLSETIMPDCKPATVVISQTVKDLIAGAGVTVNMVKTDGSKKDNSAPLYLARI